MNPTTSPPSKRFQAAAAALFCFTGLVLPVVSFFNYNGVPLMEAGAWQILVGLSVVVAGVAGVLAPFRNATLIVAAVGVSVVVVDLVVGLSLEMIGGWYRTGLLAVLALFLWKILQQSSREVWIILTTIMLVMVGHQLLSPLFHARQDIVRTGHSSPLHPNNSRETIVHLILDEHGSAALLAREGDKTAASHAALRRFYRQHGFTLYPNAYSHYYQSKYSIPNVLNMSAKPIAERFFTEEETGSMRLWENRTFAHLTQHERPIRVYQQYFMDYCHDPAFSIVSCLSANSALGLLDYTRFPLSGTITLLLSHYAAANRETVLGRSLHAVWNMRQKPAWLIALFDQADVNPITQQQRYSQPLAALHLLDSLFDDLQRDEPGGAYFAHILIPHNPYMLDETCRVKRDVTSWLTRVNPDRSMATGAARDQRYRLYDEQLRCLYTTLDERVTALKQTGKFDTMRFFIHGDHGSRIGPLLDEKWLQRQMDGFSTLLAMRRPGEEGRIDLSARSVQDAASAFYLHEGRFTDQPPAPWAYLRKERVELKGLPRGETRHQPDTAAVVE
ncbi:MAG: hypothetical protein HQL50_14325 [Magnetococcales bacterium]|nr:hypothetical protein [Magnetococcales bacterium]